jgi:hypothetical protein
MVFFVSIVPKAIAALEIEQVAACADAKLIQ